MARPRGPRRTMYRRGVQVTRPIRPQQRAWVGTAGFGLAAGHLILLGVGT